jgi:hypothetical protein
VPAVVKVDTETTEPDVLAGATRTLAEHRPWILCEVLRGKTEPRLMEITRPLGYAWYQITDAVPYARTNEIVGDRTFEHPMWLFAPGPVPQRMWERVTAWQGAIQATSG